MYSLYLRLGPKPHAFIYCMSSRYYDTGTPPSARPEPPAARFALRIGIVHGNRMTADLIRTYAITQWGCEVVALEYTEIDGQLAIEHTKPDILIVGHALPLVDACAFLMMLKNNRPKTIVTTRRLTQYLAHRLAAMEHHAVIEEDSEGILAVAAAIERVRDGSRILSSRHTYLTNELRTNPDAFPKLLTERQEEVLVLITQAMDDDEIGRYLGMTTSTARRHRSDIMRKLNIHGTPRLIRYGIHMGFHDIRTQPYTTKPT